MRKLFAHLNFHCNPDSDPCSRLKDRPYARCSNCRVYVFADRFMGHSFQKGILGGVNKNPHIIVVDSVGCQHRCWFCYARDIVDAVDPTPPHTGWKAYKFMSPHEIAKCTECKLAIKYETIKKKRPFARFRVTGGEPLFATRQTLADSQTDNLIEAALNFWLETFQALNETVQRLKKEENIEILTYDEFVDRGRTISEGVSTWLTASAGKMELRFDTNGQLFSASQQFTEEFIQGVYQLHKAGKLDAVRVNIDYSLKGPTPIEFEWSQSRSLPIDPDQLSKPFDLHKHPQYPGIQNLRSSLREAYAKDAAFSQSLRMDIERGINFTGTSKYDSRKLGVLYASDALQWDEFAKKAHITFSEVNNPIQILGNAPYSKYIKDHLNFGGAEVLIVDSNTKNTLLKFDPFPDDTNEAKEYERMITENLEKANKIISKGVAQAKTTGKFGVQVIIRPVKRRKRKRPPQKQLSSF